MNKKITELQDKIKKLNNELYNLISKDKENELSKRVGKCFRFLNNYSNSDSWWMYFKAFKMSHNSLEGFSFQEDCNGQIIIDGKERTSFSGWEEITENEFLGKWKALREKINNMGSSLLWS